MIVRKDGPCFLMKMGVECTCYADGSATSSSNVVALYA